VRPVPNEDVLDRGAGCLLGLALGDALGAPFEFLRSTSIPRPLPVFELPWQGLPPGTTTDDTAMARNLARSLVAAGGYDPADLVARHLTWFRSGPPDVGNLTRKVLQRVSEGADAEQAAEAVWRIRGPEVSAGNGSVMYCAPLGVAYASRARLLPRIAPRLSALTHFDGRCRTATVAVSMTVAGLVRGDRPQVAAGEAVASVAELEGGEELEFLVDAVGDERPVDGPDQGFCLFAAALGLQALLRGGPFEQELVRVVTLGGDTDTNAAVAGALVGSAVGAAALPRAWLGRLAGEDGLEDEAAALARLALVEDP
jgi:ADP-ribosyl-[dinitrogen reductase] hydrolase